MFRYQKRRSRAANMDSYHNRAAQGHGCDYYFTAIFAFQTTRARLS